MEPQTVPAGALVGARERIDALSKSIVADGVSLIGDAFNAHEPLPEVAPEPQAALAMSLALVAGNQKLLSKAVIQVKERAEKAEAAVKAEREGGAEAMGRIAKLTKALVGSGTYAVCADCKGTAKVADAKPCAKCADLPGLCKRTGKR